MARNALKDAFKKACNDAPLQSPFSLLPAQVAYDENKFRHTLRPGTVQARVRMVQPVVRAAWIYSDAEDIGISLPHRLVKKSVIGTSGPENLYVCEVGLSDNTSLVITASANTVRITHVETDGTRNPILGFNVTSEETLTAIMLTILPLVLELDQKEGGSKLQDALDTISTVSGVAGWTGKNDIPEIVQTALYFTDIVIPIVMKKLTLDFGPATASSASEVEASYFTSPAGLTGALVRESLTNNWTPKFVQVNGTASSRFGRQRMTIGEAKKKYSAATAHRKWSPVERMLIEKLPDNMPVMPEVLKIADAYVNTTNDSNPVRNAMWRGVTGFGKSTGIKQLSCILNIPLLIETCSPAKEVTDFISTYVPAGTTESVVLDMSEVVMPSTSSAVSSEKVKFFDDAIAYLKSLTTEEMEKAINPSTFYMTAMMDMDMACEAILGRAEEMDFNDLCLLFTEVHTELKTAPLLEKVAALEAAGNTVEANPQDDPKFIHVVANYAKAMINGYLIEVQEPSRIRDSGVLVGLNEYNRPGAIIRLMNGGMARRHPDALCVFTDNVGYNSCRPIDPSVIRRMDLIIDSYDLPKEMLIDRAARNTGCTDNSLLELAYDLWKTIKEFCEQNSIVEGSISPVEMERFVQAVHHEGLDSLTENLNYCMISKASSSIDDQREIRAACSAIYSAVAA